MPRCGRVRCSAYRGKPMRRREFITLLGGAVAWPLAVHAQQPGQPHVGYLASSADGTPEISLASFRRGLADTGFIEGRNVVVEYHFADGTIESSQTLAAN